MQGISKDERELYDRQIRLWGLEGQSRLQKSRVLLLGINASAVEVAKNLVLAGVGSLTLQSHQLANEKSLGYNFFIEPSQVGQNAAEASKIAVQRLNPKVAVTVETRTISELNDEFISEFDVVILNQCYEKTEIERINNCVRKNGAFYYSLMHGWMGLMFVDLGERPHTYEVEREFSSTGPQLTPYQELVSSQKSSNGTKVRLSEKFTSFSDAINAGTKFTENMKLRAKNKVTNYLPGFLAMLNGTTIMAQMEKLGLPKQNITTQFLAEFENGKEMQVKAVASVLGGFLSQDIINYLTQREYPTQNTLIYDALRGQGLVYQLK